MIPNIPGGEWKLIPLKANENSNVIGYSIKIDGRATSIASAIKSEVAPNSDFTLTELQAIGKLLLSAPKLYEALLIAQQYVNVFMIRGEEPLVGDNLKIDSFKIREALKLATE
jgi:hypothetical protein